MSIPRVDPNYKMKDLQKYGDQFIKAGYKYWEEMQKAGIGGAVAWINTTDGYMAIFTRGEYGDQIVANIEHLGPTYSFGAGATDAR